MILFFYPTIMEYSQGYGSGCAPYFVHILPASSDQCRNVSQEDLLKPPPFMDTVKEMRERLNLNCFGKDEDVDTITTAYLRRWKAENKRIYGSKVVSACSIITLIMTKVIIYFSFDYC